MWRRWRRRDDYPPTETCRTIAEEAPPRSPVAEICPRARRRNRDDCPYPVFEFRRNCGDVGHRNNYLLSRSCHKRAGARASARARWAEANLRRQATRGPLRDHHGASLTGAKAPQPWRGLMSQTPPVRCWGPEPRWLQTYTYANVCVVIGSATMATV